MSFYNVQKIKSLVNKKVDNHYNYFVKEKETYLRLIMIIYINYTSFSFVLWIQSKYIEILSKSFKIV